ncbi:protein kinasedomain-containing protein [Cordyceps javanica]|uniref:Protein kinasedomain-containing protein n=1 Tax=Cordyceps javanica TaxID=43265 RepID=A0A545W652_9HYPO|nr:protein kinasedomain-containing protein [Cordyceps javanica]TQW09355.1 protein kinase domain-containing protein [Cordyceps javanica]
MYTILTNFIVTSNPVLLWPLTAKRYCGVLQIRLCSAHISLPSDENTRDSLGLLREDGEWKIYAIVDCGLHQRSSAASYWKERHPKSRAKGGAKDTDVFWQQPEAILHYWVSENSPKITVHIIAQNHGTETTVLLCSFRAEPKQLETWASLQVDSHYGQGSLSLRLDFSPQEFPPLSELLFTPIPEKLSPGKVAYVELDSGLIRYALVAVRSTAQSPIRNDLLDATHGAAPFICPVSSVYQAERTLFYLLTAIPGGGNLFVHLQRERRFTEARVRRYGAQLISALEWLHSNNTVACLRPETVMLDCFDYICLCAPEAFILGAGATPVGCLAPELSEGLQRTKMADWWDLGILLYEMLTGLPPLLPCAGQDGRKKKRGDDLSFPGYLSSPAKELLGMLLHSDPEKRLGARGAQEILSSSFFQSRACQGSPNRDTNVFRSSCDDDVLTLEPRDGDEPVSFPERRTSRGVVYEKQC